MYIIIATLIGSDKAPMLIGPFPTYHAAKWFMLCNPIAEGYMSVEPVTAAENYLRQKLAA